LAAATRFTEELKVARFCLLLDKHNQSVVKVYFCCFSFLQGKIVVDHRDLINIFRLFGRRLPVLFEVIDCSEEAFALHQILILSLLISGD